jgi:catechol 2,3-dioxygenase-like lactoylglutathione lyase family enzyme
MTIPLIPVVECEQFHPGLSVPDVSAAADFYANKLGFRLLFKAGDPPHISGVDLGGVSLHFHTGKANPAGCSIYFVIGDADELYEFHKANGVDIIEAPSDKPYELRDYRIRDFNGYELVFGHRIYNTGEPIKIERVDVPVRLEKRLAALLHDLADHKRMSVAGTLEEMLLHSFEEFGDSVASPHTKRTLRYIKDLKKKHGIDYDSHGSYRFVEK